ncbi:hypothetical protein [Sphingomonas soli]|uniref:hypothetical protein n=1 Tax=Sphingomonas soli TaxID=266127 RepID=UPI000A776B99|nr:hypothetical protein [Sphingomonas soli]
MPLVEKRRAEHDRFVACLKNYRSKTPWTYDEGSDFYAAVGHVKFFSAYRCSIKPGTGCIKDQDWQRFQQVVGNGDAPLQPIDSTAWRRVLRWSWKRPPTAGASS